MVLVDVLIQILHLCLHVCFLVHPSIAERLQITVFANGRYRSREKRRSSTYCAYEGFCISSG